MTSVHSDLSRTLTKSITKTDKKDEGIYFTSSKTVNTILKSVEELCNDIDSVLEPSCGSCEFVDAIQNYYPNAKIIGVEKNKTIFKSIKDKTGDTIHLFNDDYLNWNNKDKFDLIVGNPPYFVMKKKDVDKDYYDYFDGRPNIFLLFIIISLQKLKEKGILAFVLPKSFLTCLYYDKTRKFIADNYRIIDIQHCSDDYLETKQETIYIILRNEMNVEQFNNSLTKTIASNRFNAKSETDGLIQKYQNGMNAQISNNKRYIDTISMYTIFIVESERAKFDRLRKNCKTLHEKGFDVSIGSVVWNQCKNKLTGDDSKTRLIYSSDICDHELTMMEYNNKSKKNFIDKKGIAGPMLVMNRGYGVGTYKFEYCLINIDKEYLIENHLICIKYISHDNDEDVLDVYNKLIRSLDDKRTHEFVRVYFSNNAINLSELAHILPIYEDL